MFLSSIIKYGYCASKQIIVVFPKEKIVQKLLILYLFRTVVPWQVLESFIRRALAWENHEETMRGFFFHSKNEESHELGILMALEETLPVQKLRKTAPSFKGFHLAIIKLEEVISKQTQGDLISCSQI